MVKRRKYKRIRNRMKGKNIYKFRTERGIIRVRGNVASSAKIKLITAGYRESVLVRRK